MNDNLLKRYALISEIVGGLAVLITLIILVIEVRQNTVAMRASTYDSISADIANLQMSIATDDSLSEAEFIRQSSGREALSPLQNFQRNHYFVSLFMMFERAFIQWESGNMEDRHWERFRESICRIATPGFEENVGPMVDSSTTPEFKEYRLENC